MEGNSTMTELKYNTREYSTPQGKPKVYFTAHTDDYCLFFEEVCKDILERQDCAIFYLDAKSNYKDVEDYELQLSEMQLFVVPITSKLLTTPNRALDVDIQFALSNHIPILPLMQEEKLELLFNEKFGNLQFLNKNSNDTTAITFSKKLTEYLNSVIIGDELAEKIRSSFDAYIFLSYRKKDRRYAHELMKLIHSNPFCRDIAIWYDEFLTPGENFNGSIRAALEKSDIFVLTVTPGILEKPDGNPNFVMGVEYPEALKYSKAILPVEMCPSNRDELMKNYSNIPEIISAKDGDKLASRLLELTKNYTSSENDSDPEHNYYIGLAYLSGIDVEINHELAVELITSAAMCDYYPAIDKLVDMYFNGEGVKRDLNRAVEWQKKLISIDKKSYDKKRSMDNAETLLYDMKGLSSKYFFINLHEERKRIDLEIIELCDQIVSKYSKYRFFMIRSVKKRFLVYKAEALDDLGNISLKNNNFEEAEKYYSEALKIRKIIKGKWDYEEDVISSYCNFADLARKRGDLKQALDFYNKCIKIIGQDKGSYYLKHCSFDVALIYRCVADIYFDLGDYKHAEEYRIKAIELFMMKVIEEKSSASLYYISSEYSGLAEIAGKNLETNRQLEYLENALQYARDYVKNSNYENRYIILCYALIDLGDYYFSNNNDEQAKAYYSEAHDIANEKFKNSDDYSCIKCLIQSIRNLGIFYKYAEKQDKSRALVLFEKAVTLAENKVELSNSVYTVAQIVYDYLNLSTLTLDHQKEKEYLKKVDANYDKLEKISSHENGKITCASCAITLGDYYGQKNDITSMEMYCKKAIFFAKQVVLERSKLSKKKMIFDCYMKLGEIYIDSDCLLALDNYTDALKIIDEIIVESNSLEDSICLRNVLKKIGGIYYLKLEKYNEAYDFFQRCAMIGEVVVDEIDNVGSYRELAICYDCLSSIARKIENKDDMLKWEKKQIEINSTLAEKTDSPEDYDDLLSIIVQYGNDCLFYGLINEALVSYLKCYDISKMLCDKNETGGNLMCCFEYSCKLGSISFRHLGNDVEGERYFAVAYEYIEKAIQLEPSNDRSFQLSEYYGLLAEFERHKNNMQMATEYINKQIEILKNCTEATNAPEDYNSLAYAYVAYGKLTGDNTYMVEAKNIWTRLIDNAEEDYYREFYKYNMESSLNESAE